MACGGDENASPVREELPLLFAGCAAVDGDGRCAVEPGASLTLWVPGRGAAELLAGTTALEVTPHETGGGETGGGDSPDDPAEDDAPRARVRAMAEGLRFTLDGVDPSWGTLTIRRDDAEGLLPLRPAAVPGPIVAARAARARGELDEAEAHLAGWAPEGTRERGLLEGVRARLAFSRGDNAACLRHYARSMRLLQQAGARSELVSDGLARAFVLHRRMGRVEEARGVLEALAPHVEGDPVGALRLALTLGTLQHSLGDLRGALETLRRASRDAERLGMLMERAGADEIRADALLRLGRVEEADALMEALAEPMRDAAPCTRATWYANLGHQRMLGADDPARLRSALAPLERARDLFADACPRPASLANAWANLADAALRLGDEESAREAVDAGKALEAPDATVRAWLLALDAELALEAGAHEEALARYAELERRADAAGWTREVWRGALGRGRALAELERGDAAREAFDAAEAALDRLYRRLPLDGAQGRALARHEASARERVRLALAAGDFEAAFRVARHARARRLGAAHRAARFGRADARRRAEGALADYWARRRTLRAQREAAWAAPEDALEARAAEARILEDAALEALDRAFPPLAEDAAPPLDEGALTLVLFPLDDAGDALAVLASHAGAFRGAIRPAMDALEGLDEPIESAASIRVLAHGPAVSLDVHLLPWRGAPLGAQKPVVWALDARGAPTRQGRGALVVGDPRGDLAGARDEARAVAALHRARGERVRLLLGPQATHGALLDALPTVAHLHYAGHGDVEEAGLWGSGLRLAGDERLTTGDVLALPAAPESVLLSGCETGQPAEELALGLANAFLAAGARRVVGTTRAVDDATAASVGGALEREARAPWPERLRRLVAERGDEVGAYRVYVP